MRNHSRCEKVGGTMFVLHSHRTRQDHVHHQNGKWPQTHCYLRACHRQGDIKVGPLASRTTSPIDGIVVLARGRLPQRSQNWSVLQDDWQREEKTGPRYRQKTSPLRKNGDPFCHESQSNASIILKISLITGYHVSIYFPYITWYNISVSTSVKKNCMFIV